MGDNLPQIRKSSLGELPKSDNSDNENLERPRKGSVALGETTFRRPSASQGTENARRFSILNSLGIGKQPEQPLDYEVVGSSFYLPPNFDNPDTSAHSQQFRDFFSRSQSVNTSRFDQLDDNEGGGWLSPESWGVLEPPMAPTERATLVDNPDCGELWVIRVFRPDIRRMSRDFSSVPTLDNDGLMYVTVSGPVDTLAADLYPALARKFFGGNDIGRYRLFVQHAGLETMVADDTHPFEMQKAWFEELGYMGRGEINNAISQEHSYVCRFSLKDMPSVSRPVLRRDSANAFTAENLTAKYALLGNLNLSVVPIDLFHSSSTLETIDLSRNTLLTLPNDLFTKLSNLKLLILRQNLLLSVPPAIFSAQSITNLDLSSNRLCSSSLMPLKDLPSLISLNLTSNRIDVLPEELGALTNLQSLIVSSNFLTVFSPVLFKLSKLKELDLSFNMIQSVPSDVERLSDLQCLILTGNSLTEMSPSIQSCTGLRCLDIRGNLMQDLRCIYECHNLLDLRADYNQLNSVDDPSWPRIVELSLSKNSLCKVSFKAPMNYLRILDLSGNRIGLVPDDFFELLPAAEYINLNDNQLTAIPASAQSLRALVKFTAANNQLAECNLKFDALVKLKILDLHNNNLKRLPSELWLAPSLAVINLSSNFFSSLPSLPAHTAPLPLYAVLEEIYMGENQCRNEVLIQLSKCHELRRLNLSMNDIYDFPVGMSCFERLVELYLSHNQISSLPDDINRATRLRVLLVNNNRLSTLPGELCDCKELRVLDASCNSLRFNVTNVPYDWNWRRNPELVYLSLGDNPKLDINPPNQSLLSGAELAHFRGLPKLRSLNLTNVRVKPESVPEETTSLRVRTNWSDIAGYKVGVAEVCGRRMRCDVFDFSFGRFSDDLGSDCLFGVFDGKGTANVSNFLYQYFPSILHVVMNGKSQEVDDSLRLAFLSSNADLSTQPIELRAGSTATILYIREDSLYIANAGDTVAVLSREGRALDLTTKHYAWSRAEMDRLRCLGGNISMNGLVEGEIELTRAIGFLHLLPFINASPSVHSVSMTEQDEFVIIGSGSLWRSMSMQTAVDIVRKEPSDLTIAAQRIRDLALAYSVSPDDSVAVMVVGLKQRRSTDPQSTAIADPYASRRRRIREDIQDSILARLPKEIDPPTGSLAMVFTDIRDSTVLWETATAPMRVAKKMHHMIMRRALRNIGGYEVKTEGDAFMVTFPTAAKAIRWCLTVQLELLDADWPSELLRSPICGPQKIDDRLVYRGISVRMGIHYGEMECEQDMVTGRMDYNGIPVIIASRVQSQALGGQILVTDACRQQFAKEEADDNDARIVESTLKALFIDVGHLSLKGIEAREHVHALYPDSLAQRYVGLPAAVISKLPDEKNK